MGKTDNSSAKDNKEKKIIEGKNIAKNIGKIVGKIINLLFWPLKNVKKINVMFNKCMLLIFITATIFLILNGTEDFANFVNRVYQGVKWGDYTLLDIYKHVDPYFVLVMPYLMIGSIGTMLISNVFVRVFAVIVNWIRERYGMIWDEKNAFNVKLYDYLTSPVNRKCIVVTAAWGQGKSYLIRKFMEEFTRYRWKHVYTVSCFGIENREQLKELLENEMYCQDTSIDKIFIKLLEHIPVIGSIVALLREQKYSMKKITQKDIIILEDVERIVPPGVKEEGKEKLNVVAGFVHELVDRYQNKVILVCNVDDFNKTIYQDCIYKKLACEEVSISNDCIVIPFMEEAFIEKNISIKNIKQMKEILIRKEEKEDSINDTIVNVLNKAKIENKRLMQKVFSNQAYFCKYLKNENDTIAIDFLYSYLLWEIAKEKADELLDYLKGLNDTYTFPELYLKIIEKRQNFTITGNEWWHCLIYFSKTHYWVGIPVLEAYSKNAEDIVSGGDDETMKMLEEVEVTKSKKSNDLVIEVMQRSNVKSWHIINKVNETRDNGKEIKKLFDEEETDETEKIIDEFDKVANISWQLAMEEQNLLEYVNAPRIPISIKELFLVKAYLYEMYVDRYGKLRSEKIRNFIVYEYEVEESKISYCMRGYANLYFRHDHNLIMKDIRDRTDKVREEVRKDQKEIMEYVEGTMQEESKEGKVS